MKHVYVFVLILFSSFVLFSQERFLTVKSKDSIDNKPKFKSSLGVNMKLNAYYDLFGGLQDNETFNVGLINVFGTDDTSSFHIDMYQTQMKLESNFVLEEGREVKAIVEWDFWGGNGHMRLRKAYIESKHWQIGQNWNAFGDEVLWPNIMEWEGPPSGIWVRSPHIKYFNTFKNKNWSYEISLEAPITDFNRFEEFDTLVDDEYQLTPDFVMAVKNSHDWGHIRLSSILRSIRYSLDDKTDNFTGYGFSLSGIYKTENRNNFQFQLVGGKGITAYLTSVAGLGYDGYPNSNDKTEATPVFGGWASYEYFITKKLHTNIVFGYTSFDLTDAKRILNDSNPSERIIVLEGDAAHSHYYGILNFMYDAYERMTIGLELDYGAKKLDVNGYLNNTLINEAESRDAMRISFGFMFYF